MGGMTPPEIEIPLRRGGSKTYGKRVGVPNVGESCEQFARPATFGRSSSSGRQSGFGLGRMKMGRNEEGAEGEGGDVGDEFSILVGDGGEDRGGEVGDGEVKLGGRLD